MVAHACNLSSSGDCREDLKVDVILDNLAKFPLKIKLVGTGERAWHLEALMVLPEDPSSVPNPHRVVYNQL